MNGTDEDTKKKIVDTLYWDDRVDASRIDVEVSGGCATLRGTASSYSAKQAAVRDVRRTAGVTDVVDEIEIEHPTGEEVPSDEELRTSIMDLLKWNPDIESDDVEVNVYERIVTLEGTVGAYWKKMRGEELISYFAGVREIKNHLTVVPSQDVQDRTVASEINEALERDSLASADDVTVEVENGVVTLTGSVSNWVKREAAVSAALNTAGVVEVVDELVVLVD